MNEQDSQAVIDALQELMRKHVVLAAKVRALTTRKSKTACSIRRSPSPDCMETMSNLAFTRAASLVGAYWCARSILSQYLDGEWDKSMPDPEKGKSEVAENFRKMRFIGFDSFKGIPRIEGVDKEMPVFAEGTYAAGMDEVRKFLADYNVNMDQMILVPGFFNESCSGKTAEDIGLTSIAVVHIDSDLYASAVTALDFCTPYFRDGSVVIFDEWFQFHGNPNHGEQRAFREWRAKNPLWHAAELGDRSVSKSFVLNRV